MIIASSGDPVKDKSLLSSLVGMIAQSIIDFGIGRREYDG